MAQESIDKNKAIEKSIQKKFHKQLFTPFAKAINRYELLQPGDKVAVCAFLVERIPCCWRSCFKSF